MHEWVSVLPNSTAANDYNGENFGNEELFKVGCIRLETLWIEWE